MNVRELLPASLLAHHRPSNQRPGRWYAIRDQAGDDRTRVDLYDAIGDYGITAGEFVRDLLAIDTAVIELHINSPGGVIFDGLTIHNALRDHPARVEAIVDGLAASSASWVLQAAEVRTMNRHAEVFIHDGLMLTIGTEADHLDSAALLGRMSDSIAGIYAERAGGTVAGWRSAMRAETWYGPQEAVDAGLADDRVDDNDDQADNYSPHALLVTARARAHNLERTA